MPNMASRKNNEPIISIKLVISKRKAMVFIRNKIKIIIAKDLRKSKYIAVIEKAAKMSNTPSICLNISQEI